MNDRPQVGGFQLLRPIGRGGMGVVYQAEHVPTGQPAAVKLLAQPDPDLARGFETEVAAVAALEHPHIVRVFDQGRTKAPMLGVAAGVPWLALELLDGGSAHELGGRFEWDELASLLDDLLRALAHAHARDVLHRDVKPGNVLRRTGMYGGWVLTDFGLAHGRGRDGLPAATWGYAAPEQLARRVQLPSTDLFAVGALAWALATGKAPFRCGAPRVLGRFEPVRPMPGDLEAWIRAACAPDPSARFELAADALAALRLLGTVAATQRIAVDPTRLADAPTELRPVAARAAYAAAPATDPAPPVAPWPRSWRRPRLVPPTVPLAGAGLGTLPLREPPMVGRDAQHEAFWDVLDRVRREGAEGLWVHGEAGVGVEASVRAVLGGAMELGAARVVRLGRHRPLRELVRTVLGPADVQDALTQLGVPPGGRHAMLGALDGDHLDPSWLNLLLPWGARRRPLVVWAQDPQVISALAQWLRGAPAASVLVVGCEEPTTVPPSGWTDLPLPSLSPGAMHRFVELLLPLAPTAASWLVDVADGRPDEAMDILNTWLVEGRLQAGPEGFAPEGRLERPVDGSARARWRAWLGRCTVRERQALEVLAVWGHPVPHELVDAVAGRPLRPVLGRLVARALVDDDGEAVSVATDLLDAVRAETDPVDARTWHGRVAEALAKQGPWRDVAGEVGWHRLRAGDAEGAVLPLLDGADAARIRGRFDEALVRLEHAAEALELVDPDERWAGPRAHLGWQRGWTLESQGHADAAGDELLRAVHLAELAGDADAVVLARRARAGFLRRRGDREGAMRCLLAARPWVGHSARHAGALYLELALVHHSLNDLTKHQEALEKALRCLRHDDPLYGDALYFRALAELHRDELDAALRFAASAMGAYGRLGMTGGMGSVHDILATVARRRGDLAEAEAQLRAAARLHVGSMDRAVGLANLGLVLIDRGDQEGAAEALWESVGRFRRLRFQRMEGLAHAALVGPLVALGHWSAAAHHLEQALELVGSDLVDADVADVVLDALERLARQRCTGLVPDAATLAGRLIGPGDATRRARLVALRTRLGGG